MRRNAVREGLSPTPRTVIDQPGRDAPAASQKAPIEEDEFDRGESPRTREVRRTSPPPSRAPVAQQPPIEDEYADDPSDEGPIDDRRRPTGGESRKQDGALHLGAGDGEHMMASLEPAATHGKRGTPAIGLDACTHAVQRLDHPSHGPTPQGSITVERRRDTAAAEHSQQ